MPSAGRLRSWLKPPSGTCFHWQFWCLLRLRRTPVGSSASASGHCRNQYTPAWWRWRESNPRPAHFHVSFWRGFARLRSWSLRADESPWWSGADMRNRTASAQLGRLAAGLWLARVNGCCAPESNRVSLGYEPSGLPSSSPASGKRKTRRSGFSVGRQAIRTAHGAPGLADGHA